MRYSLIAAALVGAVMAAPSVAPPASYGSEEVETPASPPSYGGEVETPEKPAEETESSPEAPSSTDKTVYVTITSCSADVKDCPATAVPTVPAGGEGHDLPSYTAPVDAPAQETPVTGGEAPKSPSTNPPHVSPPKDEGEEAGHESDSTTPPVYGGEEGGDKSPSENPPHLSPSAPAEAPATPTGYESDSSAPPADEGEATPPVYGGEEGSESHPEAPEESPEAPVEHPETGYESHPEAPAENPETGYESGAEAPGYGEEAPAAPYPVANGTAPVYPTGTAAPAPSGSAGGAYPPTQIGNGASGLKVAGLFTAMGAVAAFFL